MLVLIFAIIFGLGLAFFATQNTNGVTITLANYPLTNTPLWVIVVVSILVGIICASFFNVVNIISSALRLHGKDTRIKDAGKTITELKKENQALSAEISSLKSKKESSQ